MGINEVGIELFAGANSGHAAFDVVVGDAKKVLGTRSMSPLTHTGILGFTLNSTILSLHFKRIFTGSTCFRPPLFALKENGIIFRALGCDGYMPRLIVCLFGAGFSFGREFLELPGSARIYGFAPTTMNVHKCK
jgi:hypothetical protein